MNRIITLVAIVIMGLVALGGTRMALAQTTSALEALRAREQLDALFIQVRAAIDQAAGNPRALVEALPRELREGNEQMFEAILNMQPGQTAQRLFSGSPDDPAREVFSRQVRVLSRRYAPERHPLMLEREALNAIVNQGSANWPYFKGHFLAPELPAPYGTFTPNCENHWCVPDLYISDYDETDLDGRPGNFCSLVPDFWFRWPCYQHDIAYAFAPMAADSKIGSFLAVNWQWWGDMRTECHERIRFDWLNPEFIVCQAVAFTYWFGVNTFAFPVFNEPNRIKGYDVLDGEEPDLRRAPVYRRWHACTGTHTESRPFVSYNRQVLGSHATVPQGAILELSGRTHRGTRILFEFVDPSGNTVANHLTDKSGDNCIIAQEPEQFNTSVLPVGTYTVKAHYYAWEGRPGPQFREDWAYDPPRTVAYGTPLFETVMNLTVTGPVIGGGGGGGGSGDPCEYTKTGCLPGDRESRYR